MVAARAILRGRPLDIYHSGLRHVASFQPAKHAFGSLPGSALRSNVTKGAVAVSAMTLIVPHDFVAGLTTWNAGVCIPL